MNERENAIKFHIDKSEKYSKKIYELMEGIYIRGFAQHMNNEAIILNAKNIVKNSEWLVKNSKDNLTSLESREMETIQNEVAKIYEETDDFKNFITLQENGESIEINNLEGFREKINELLGILPFDIYSRDL